MSNDKEANPIISFSKYRNIWINWVQCKNIRSHWTTGQCVQMGIRTVHLMMSTWVLTSDFFDSLDGLWVHVSYWQWDVHTSCLIYSELNHWCLSYFNVYLISWYNFIFLFFGFNEGIGFKTSTMNDRIDGTSNYDL